VPTAYAADHCGVTIQPPLIEANSPSGREILTVSRLNAEARILLERGLGSVWIEGEVSNLSRPASGHWYLTLKDSGAQVRCAMFRMRNVLVRFPVRDGSQVLARARVSLYEPRGEFQLVIDHLEEAGEGLLRRRFEELKRSLAAEGLFDADRKRRLPRLPHRIGVITSPTGAAIRDILHVLGRRFPAIPVLIYPVPVQGDGAPGAIIRALQLAARRAECDVLILARGGGSLEDLWAFNDEGVARAIAACPLPTISGIGHEVDFTIADFVADERAPTPSGAAERVVPDRAEWSRLYLACEARLASCIRRAVQRHALELRVRSDRLARMHPGVRLRQHAQRLDELDARMRLAVRTTLGTARQRARTAHALLLRASPSLRLTALRQRLIAQRRALDTAGRLVAHRGRTRLELAMRALHAVSPLATIDRGYAIVTDAAGHVLRDARRVAAGSAIEARLARGRLFATVTRADDDEPQAQ
jgi:exodeoxyribonuclease VII large subunit